MQYSDSICLHSLSLCCLVHALACPCEQATRMVFPPVLLCACMLFILLHFLSYPCLHTHSFTISQIILCHSTISVIFSMSYYAFPGILGTLMSQTVTLCPRLVFVSIVTLVFGNNECSPPSSHYSCPPRLHLVGPMPSFTLFHTLLAYLSCALLQIHCWGGVESGGNPHSVHEHGYTHTQYTYACTYSW